MAVRHADTPRFHSRAHDGFHLCGLRRGVRPLWLRSAAHAVPVRDLARHADHRQRADNVHPAPRGRDYPDVFHLRLRQYRDGCRHSAGGGSAPAAHQLRRHLAGVDLYRHRHPDEHPLAQEAGADVMTGIRHVAAALLVATLAGCGSAPTREPPAKRPGGFYLDDGPGANPPANIDSIPDAVPRAEPINRGTARPYVVMGRSYTPMTTLAPYSQRGIASWYGRRYHGKPTSSGEPYDMYAMTAAHTTLP